MNDTHVRRAYDPDEGIGLSDDFDPADFDDFDDLDEEPEDDEDPEQDPEGAW